MRTYDLISSDGLNGKKWAIRKKVKIGPWFWRFSGTYYLCVNGNGVPDSYTEYESGAWWGNKREAEKLKRIVEKDK